MRCDFLRDFDLTGRRVFDSLVQVLVLDVEFGCELDFGVVGIGIGLVMRSRRRHGGRGRGFCLMSFSVLPPGESDCAVSELFSGRVLRLLCYLTLSAQSLSRGLLERGVVSSASRAGRAGLLFLDSRRLAATCPESLVSRSRTHDSNSSDDLLI
jgi:hypothetical protein